MHFLPFIVQTIIANTNTVIGYKTKKPAVKAGCHTFVPAGSDARHHCLPCTIRSSWLDLLTTLHPRTTSLAPRNRRRMSIPSLPDRHQFGLFLGTDRRICLTVWPEKHFWQPESRDGIHLNQERRADNPEAKTSRRIEIWYRQAKPPCKVAESAYLLVRWWQKRTAVIHHNNDHRRIRCILKATPHRRSNCRSRSVHIDSLHLSTLPHACSPLLYGQDTQNANTKKAIRGPIHLPMQLGFLVWT